MQALFLRYVKNVTWGGGPARRLRPMIRPAGRKSKYLYCIGSYAFSLWKGPGRNAEAAAIIRKRTIVQGRASLKRMIAQIFL